MPIPIATPPAPPSAPAPAGDRFAVGRDPKGHWVALAADGHAGGYFRTLADALHYAAIETGHRPDGVVLSAGLIALRL